MFAGPFMNLILAVVLLRSSCYGLRHVQRRRSSTVPALRAAGTPTRAGATAGDRPTRRPRGDAGCTPAETAGLAAAGDTLVAVRRRAATRPRAGRAAGGHPEERRRARRRSSSSATARRATLTATRRSPTRSPPTAPSAEPPSARLPRLQPGQSVRPAAAAASARATSATVGRHASATLVQIPRAGPACSAPRPRRGARPEARSAWSARPDRRRGRSRSTQASPRSRSPASSACSPALNLVAVPLQPAAAATRWTAATSPARCTRRPGAASPGCAPARPRPVRHGPADAGGLRGGGVLVVLSALLFIADIVNPITWADSVPRGRDVTATIRRPPTPDAWMLAVMSDPRRLGMPAASRPCSPRAARPGRSRSAASPSAATPRSPCSR